MQGGGNWRRALGFVRGRFRCNVRGAPHVSRLNRIDVGYYQRAEQHWLALTNALSGLFFASLNFIYLTWTIWPFISFRTEGDHPDATLASMRLLYGMLPHEVVCTENLTPFLKLLPCKGKASNSTFTRRSYAV